MARARPAMAGLALLLAMGGMAVTPGGAAMGAPAPGPGSGPTVGRVRGSGSVSVGDPAVRAAIDAVVAKARRTYGHGGAVPGVLMGVWDGHGGRYVHGYGVADLATGAPLTEADHVRIGSNTKTFVVTVLLQLVDEGLVSLDDPLSKFAIGVVVPNASHITLRELCDMRSGLFEAFDTPQFQGSAPPPNSHWDPRTIIGWAVREKPYFAPDGGYHYSNTNYLILGEVIEAVTGHPLGEEIARRLLVPYKLRQTSYPTAITMPSPWAHGYAAKPGGGWEDVSDTIPVSMTGAAGNMVSDLDDMRRWVELYVSGRTNSAATQLARLDCKPIGAGPDSGLGFGLGIACSAGWFGYTGGLPGYNTAAWYQPAEKVTVLAFVTLQADKPPPGVANALVREVARIVTPAHVPMEKMGEMQH